MQELLQLDKALKVSDKPETYSIKKPSEKEIEEAVKLLLEGKVSQVALFYSKKNIVYHLYRDKKNKYYVVDTSLKKPVKKEVELDKINIREIIDKYGLPYEILLFK